MDLSRSPHLEALSLGQGGPRVLAALEGHEGLADSGVKLRAEVLLDFRKRMLLGEAVSVGAVARHCVIAVSDDQKMGGERDVTRVDPVVAASVRALVVVFDRPRLVLGEPKATEEARGEPRMTTHYLPFLLVELARLAQDGAVDGDLPEVVEPAGPAQPGYVNGREAEPLGELLDVVRNSS